MLLVGLGNPGIKYKNNIHNVGFLIIDYLAKHLFNTNLKEKGKNYDVLENFYKKKKIILLKPNTFMNNSGLAVQQALNFYKIDKEDVFVFHDDITTPKFLVKQKLGGGDAGHNGLRSITNAIGNEYWRVRIGVGRPENAKIDVASYVLSDFKLQDLEKFTQIFDVFVNNFDEFIKKELDNIMNTIRSII